MIHVILSDKFLAMSNNAKLLYLMIHASLDQQYNRIVDNLDTMIKLIDAHDTAKKELLDNDYISKIDGVYYLR
jgi:predicted glycoside hydrolase/deacetylase ChbG (UPF0249 family)